MFGFDSMIFVYYSKRSRLFLKKAEIANATYLEKFSKPAC